MPKTGRDAGVRKILAAIYLRQNRTQEAALLYEDVLRIKPDDTGAMKDLAHCYLQNNRSDQAIEVLQKLAGLQKQDAEVYAMLGLAYGIKNLWNQSADYFAQAVRLDPDHAERRLLLAQAYEKAGKIDAATEQYQYLAHPREGCHLGLGVPSGISLLKKGISTGLSPTISGFFRKKPDDAATWANLATAHAGKGKFKEEMECLQKAVSLAPDDPVIHFNLAEAYEKRDKMDARHQGIPAGAGKEPRESRRSGTPGGSDAEKIKSTIWAVAYYEKVAPRFRASRLPSSSIWDSRTAKFGQYGKSAESYEKAVKLGARGQTLYYNLAYTYTRLGRDKEAVAYYEKIVPQTLQTLGMIADYHLKNKNFERAISYYQRIVKLAPKKASTYFSMGYAYAANKNYDRAISNYLAALKYDPEDDATYANLGEVYEKKGLYAEALKAYKAAYELNPDTRVGDRIPKLTIQMMDEKRLIPRSRS